MTTPVLAAGLDLAGFACAGAAFLTTFRASSALSSARTAVASPCRRGGHSSKLGADLDVRPDRRRARAPVRGAPSSTHHDQGGRDSLTRSQSARDASCERESATESTHRPRGLAGAGQEAVV